MASTRRRRQLHNGKRRRVERAEHRDGSARLEIESLALEEIRQLEVDSRPYDENLGRGLEDGERAALRLFRIVGSGR